MTDPDGFISPEDAVMGQQGPVRPREAIPAHEAALVRVALRVLSGRAVAVLGVALVFALGCWAMLNPTPLRVLIAGGFAVFSLLAQMLLAWAER